MIHKKCGGVILEDRSIQYPLEREDGSVEHHSRLYCFKCKKEITGDEQVEEIV